MPTWSTLRNEAGRAPRSAEKRFWQLVQAHSEHDLYVFFKAACAVLKNKSIHIFLKSAYLQYRYRILKKIYKHAVVILRVCVYNKNIHKKRGVGYADFQKGRADCRDSDNV